MGFATALENASRQSGSVAVPGFSPQASGGARPTLVVWVADSTPPGTPPFQPAKASATLPPTVAVPPLSGGLGTRPQLTPVESLRISETFPPTVVSPPPRPPIGLREGGPFQRWKRRPAVLVGVILAVLIVLGGLGIGGYAVLHPAPKAAVATLQAHLLGARGGH